MPKRTQNGTSALLAWRGVNVRKKGQQTVGKGRTKEKEAATIVADSIHSLALRTLSGIQVAAIQEQWIAFDLPDPEKMYKDLYKCFKAYYKVARGFDAKVDLVRELGISYTEGVYRLCRMFRELIPQSASFNIDIDGNESYFTIYEQLDFPSWFHMLEVKYLLYDMRKRGKQYEDLFLDFVAAYRSYIGSGTWHDGASYYDAIIDCDCIDERIYVAEQENDEETYNALVAVKTDYTIGEASQIGELLRKRGAPALEDLKARLKAVRSKKAVFRIMLDLVEMMGKGYCLDALEYDFLQNDDGEGLRFCYQHCIVWDNQDAAASLVGEWIESEAQQGIWDPAVRLEVTPKTTLKFDGYAAEAKVWLTKLSELLSSLYTISDALREKYESANRKNNARLQAQAVCGRI